MNCQEFWNRTPERTGAPEAAWSAHLRECTACASGWAQQQNVAAGLGRVAADWSRMEAPARVEGRLLAAFRAHAGMGNVRPARQPARGWLGALTWATAAATVLVLAISLVRVHGPQSSAPRRIPANAAIMASVESAEVAAADAAETGFVPLPNVEQLAPNEQGDVVRLELPRSAMMALGFEVSPERAAEPVQAEVIYGPDGVARAVRFLDESF